MSPGNIPLGIWILLAFLFITSFLAIWWESLHRTKREWEEENRMREREAEERAAEDAARTVREQTP